MSSPGFFYSPEDQAQAQAIQRRQAYAQALMEQGASDPGKGAYGGLRNAGNAILGAFLSKRASKESADLAGQAQNRYTADMVRLLQGGTQAPQVSNAAGTAPQFQQAPEGMEGPGAPAPAPQAPTPAPNAVPGGSFMDRLIATGNPAVIQQFAPAIVQQQMQIESKRVTPISPQEAQQAGLRGIWGRDASGNLVPIQQSDVKSPEAVAQAIWQHQQEQLLSPEAFAQKRDLANIQQAPQWANINLAKQRLQMAQSGIIDPDTRGFMADQILAGDKSPFANIGRGAQGAENLAALRREVMTRAQARGLKGADLAALNAEFSGLQAGERTLGTRTANIEMAASEAQNLMPMAVAASRAVPRSQYPSLNRVQMAIQQGTGDENVVRLGVAVNGLVNTYARAISPTGNPTVSDKDHAREILDKAWASGQFEAAIGQMQQEIGAARKSPGSVRGEFRSAISGRQGGPATVPDAPSGLPNGAPAPNKRIKFGDLP